MAKAEILSTPTEIRSLLEYAENKVASGDGEMEWSKIVEELNDALDRICGEIIAPPVNNNVWK